MRMLVEKVVQKFDTSVAQSIAFADVSGCDWASIQMNLWEDAAASTYDVVVSNDAQVWFAAKDFPSYPSTATATSITIASGNSLTRMIPITDVKYLGVRAPSSGGGGTYKVIIRASSAN